MTFIDINNSTCSQLEKCSQACFSVEWCFFTIYIEHSYENMFCINHIVNEI